MWEQLDHHAIVLSHLVLEALHAEHGEYLVWVRRESDPCLGVVNV
jgi:hypothetical protein